MTWIGIGQMDRWVNLKPWQKAGIILGVAHIIIYSSVYIMLKDSMGIILVYDLEYPWMILLSPIAGGITWSGSNGEIIFLGFAGTIIYGLLALAIARVLFKAKTGIG
jgi:hypothetical protein